MKIFGKKRKLSFLLMTLCAIGSAVGVRLAHAEAQSKSLPKLGERKYLLDREDKFKPVEITADTPATEGTFLRDPVRPGEPDKSPKVIHKPKQVAQKVAALPKSVPGQMRFKRLAVSGSLVEPRIKFTRETLVVDRSDEPVHRDFFQKIFEAADR